ncbi:MAG TPA: UDP-N-acetylglucosamine--N-acetylmuramyl-(pentapeptide) pyrophosphoryl-undecaprenol N-acetylglucosamine transferase [Gaiellaceae bacterium]|nr:UDP-N-acetylglucosamine--N-acetylmuramyl-(pentapeptide) pyrophosphoryl-undecaprenol N-acetylglucosamine transferase [Gaiellaceae bacterium]
MVAAGGTAGHVLPSLAVAQALLARGASVSFAGSPDRIEARLVPEAGFEFDPFRIGGLPRRPGPAQARAALLGANAVRACARILAARRPHVVFGGGGYVAGPMVYAAWLRRIPAALAEADAHLGLANRLAAPFARRVFLAYPVPGRDGLKYRVVGRPVPRGKPVAPAEARAGFGLPAEGRVLLVAGGSLGARALNELAIDAFGAGGPAVLHLCGERYAEELSGRRLRPEYKLLPWIPDFAAALAAADLVLGRAGGSVWEVAAAGKPAVLVPSPNVTADHQTKNARYFEAAGGAVVVPESDLAGVPEVVRALLADDTRLAAMGDAMRRAARPNAADDIAEELIALASA